MVVAQGIHASALRRDRVHGIYDVWEEGVEVKTKAIVIELSMLSSNIRRMVSTAELDYIGARLLFLNELSVSAVTLGSLAIEKQLKAFLMHKNNLNEEYVKKKYSHDLNKLFEDAKKIESRFSNDRLGRIINRFAIGNDLRYPDTFSEATTTMKEKRPIDISWMNDLDYAFYTISNITGVKTIALERIQSGFHAEWKEILMKNNLYWLRNEK